MQDSDDFDSEELGKQWFFHNTPDSSGESWSLSEIRGKLRIKTKEGDISSPKVSTNLFLQRVMYKEFDITTRVTFDAQDGNESAGLHLYHDPRKSIWLTTTVVDGKKVFEVGTYNQQLPSDMDPMKLEVPEIRKIIRSTPKSKKVIARVENTIGNTVYLKMSIDGNEKVSFFYSGEGNSWEKIDAEVYFGESWHHSLQNKKPGNPDLGWVGCGRDNVWTGTVMGIFACGNEAEESKNADFNYFHVEKKQ